MHADPHPLYWCEDILSKYDMLYESPIGVLAIVSDGEAITSLRLTHADTDPGRNDAAARAAAVWLDAYFSHAPLPAMPPLKPEGSDFRKRVWAEMCRIPYGATMSYGELAHRTGSSARAVGGAVGANPIALMMPCHRVTGARGTLGGFAYSSECKLFLLNLEQEGSFQ